ncbi:MAG: GIY-YIG nuclease family protein [Erythrobacter sp.]
MAFFAYLLRCNDGSNYAGHTDDLDHRVGQHMKGEWGGCVGAWPSTSSG